MSRRAAKWRQCPASHRVRGWTLLETFMTGRQPTAVAFALLAMIAPFSANAQSWGPVTVGKSGLGADCSTPSLREAIALATNPDLGYDNEVWITDDLDGRFFDGGTILIDGKQVTVIGGYRSRTGLGCRDLVRDAHSVISGYNGSAGSVIAIRGESYVTLRHLAVGHGQADKGGGINFTGAGTLVMSDVTLFGNSANRGGGLYAEGSDPITLYLENGVKINDNNAGDGGGVYLGRNAALEWVGIETQMWFNRSTERGGGIFVADARADIRVRGLYDPASRGYHASIYGNQAKKGGAIASGKGARLRVAAFDPITPTVVAYNSATENGGAFHLGGLSDVCINESAVVGNSANRGAAVYGVLTDDSFPMGNWLAIDTSQCGFPATAWCASGSLCSRFEGNQATSGAVIDFESRAAYLVEIERTRFSGNRGSHLLYVGAGNSRMVVRRNLIVRNQIAAILKADAKFMHFTHNTIADNSLLDILDVKFRPHATGDVVVAANLVAQPGAAVLRYTGQEPFFGNVFDNLTHDVTLALWNSANLTGTPVFDHVRGNYQLAPSSPGIDATGVGPSGDLLGNGPVDLPAVPNRRPDVIGDIGALERQL